MPYSVYFSCWSNPSLRRCVHVLTPQLIQWSPVFAPANDSCVIQTTVFDDELNKFLICEILVGIAHLRFVNRVRFEIHFTGIYIIQQLPETVELTFCLQEVVKDGQSQYYIEAMGALLEIIEYGTRMNGESPVLRSVQFP